MASPRETVAEQDVLIRRASTAGHRLAFPATASGKDVLVVLMGWAGAEHRYLAKYTAMLTVQGCTCLQTIQPKLLVFSATQGARLKYAESLLDFLAASGLCQDRPLVLYSFSNGGCSVYEYIAISFDAGRYKDLKAQLAGLLFDSCPAYMYLHKGAQAMTVGMHPLLGLLMRMLFTLYSYLAIPFVGNIRTRFWRRMQATVLGIPELYIYSKTDELTTFDDLDRLVEDRQSRGVPITKLVFDQSKHVAHLRQHPEAYTAAVRDFLATIRSKSK